MLVPLLCFIEEVEDSYADRTCICNLVALRVSFCASKTGLSPQ